MDGASSFFTVATCKVEAYSLQREFRIETCKLKSPFPFVPCMLSTLHVTTVKKEVGTLHEA